MITKQEFINAYALNLRGACNEQAAFFETERSMRDFAKLLVDNLCADTVDLNADVLRDDYVLALKTASILGYPNLSTVQLGQLLRSML